MKLLSSHTSPLFLALAAALTSPVAQAELTANAAVTSNYVWRGLTQTDDGAALQGGIDWSHDDTGLYVGAWGSNVDFPDAEVSGIEYDLYAGISNTIGEFGYDVGYYTYNYTDEDADMVSEIKLGVSYGPASFNHYIGDIDAPGENEYTYDELNLDFVMGEIATLSLHGGVTDPDVSGADNVTDYSIGVAKEFAGFNVSLGVADTDIDTPDEDPVAFVMVKKEFGSGE